MWKKNPKPHKISVFKGNGLKKLYMLRHNALTEVLVRIFFSPLHVTLYTVFLFNALVVSSIFFSHRELQQWRSADVGEIPPVWHQGLALQARRGAMVAAEQAAGSKWPKPLMAAVFSGRNGSEETGFSSCPVVEVWYPKVSFSSMFVLSLPMREGARIVLLHRWEQCGFMEPLGARGLQHSDPVLHQRGVPRPFACSLLGSPLPAGWAGDAVLLHRSCWLFLLGVTTSWPGCMSPGGEGWCQRDFNKWSC